MPNFPNLNDNKQPLTQLQLQEVELDLQAKRRQSAKVQSLKKTLENKEILRSPEQQGNKRTRDKGNMWAMEKVYIDE